MPSFSRNRPDLILLHAPSVYDFRKRSIVYGPVSDLVPSTPIFEMYPVGFSSIASYMKKHGYNVRIINLALKMLLNPKFDVEKQIKKLKPKMFGIDLHWMPHCHGSVEIARLVKKYHPDIPVIFGGFSSTFFHKELIEYPEIDFVMRGDTTEEPIRMLFDIMNNGRDYSKVPNLTWKENGTVHENELSHVPVNLDGLDLGYKEVVRSVWRDMDFSGVMPFHDWIRYPIMATFACRGCNCNCVFCGGSNYCFNNSMKRKKTAYRSPEALVEEAKNISRLCRGPIFMIGDVHIMGREYAEAVIKGLAKEKIKNKIIFEFFVPPDKDFFDLVDDNLTDYSYEMSLESHDEEVRKAVGKGYSNTEIEEAIKNALSHENCERFDLYFLVGLPKQTYQKAMDVVEYCRKLYASVGNDKRLLTFVSPLAPFLDPGSKGFTNPDEVGYRLFYKTLEEHRQALLKPSWKYILNYETEWMTRDEIVDVTYDSALGLNAVKRDIGAIDKKTADITEDRIIKAKRIMEQVDEIIKEYPPEEVDARLFELKHEVDNSSMSTVCEKRELEWPIGLKMFNFKMLEVAKILINRGS
jgi:B12-binding domain/radical SAM domain protein